LPRLQEGPRRQIAVGAEKGTGNVAFVPRRFAEFDPTEEIRAPLALALAIVAIIGWALAAYLATEVMHEQSQQGDALGRPAATIVHGCGSPL
jgi:hypothetical protein